MKYSIITPVYNREDCIARCIESVLLQKNIRHLFGEIEHIIINDGSNDSTDTICKKYAKNNPIIKYLSFPKNKGTNAARNAGIKAAIGTFCIILDSDDYFVDNALNIINNVVSNNSYSEYIFSANDMLEKYSSNTLLNKNKQAVLTYIDFLSEKVSGDFIHVIKTGILKHHPFDEKLRIHEFIFFLQFYKESKNILFTNEVVTIRERSRKDSVTRETIRTNKEIINRNLKATTLLLNNFKDEYIKYGLTHLLSSYTQQKIENALLLSRYDLIKEDINNRKLNINPLYKIIFKLRIGWLYRFLLSFYLIIKYNVFQKRLK